MSQSDVPIKDATDTTRGIDTFQRSTGAGVVETQAVAIVNPATGDALAPAADGSIPVTVQGVATEATLAAGIGGAGATPPALASGATGLLGWLRGIFDRLPALVGGRLPVDIGTPTINATISSEVEVKNDAGSPIPIAGTVAVSAVPLATGAATEAGQTAIVTALGAPLQAGGAVSVSNFPATQNVAGTVAVSGMPLPSGAATAAGQAAIVTALGAPLQAGGAVALDASTLAALENTNVTLTGLTYPASTNNSSTGSLQPGGVFNGVLETIQNQQAAQIQLSCDQPYRLDVLQFIDAAGLVQSSSDSFTRRAGQPFSMNITLPGNFVRVTLTNLGSGVASYRLDVTYGIMDTQPRSLGRKGPDDAFPVVWSDDDADILNDILQRLGVLNTARNVDGSLRVTLLGGTVATVTTVGTVTTVTTVSTVSALTNQAQMGGFLSNNQIPALMNLAAASNIDRMVG